MIHTSARELAASIQASLPLIEAMPTLRDPGPGAHPHLVQKVIEAEVWIPRHPETRKGVVIDEMLRGVENKHRSGDSRIGQPFELLLNPWAGKRQPGELKHLSSQRKRKQKRFP